MRYYKRRRARQHGVYIPVGSEYSGQLAVKRWNR